ncbi:hypothetical protein HY024_01830, partial [Candidatus Curtissbacteria bacterium]|nr:hypothetical protein [Candidatus Curtissbacteria bacterium]
MQHLNLSTLRQNYKSFVYESYGWELVDSTLVLKFKFKITPGIEFNPTVRINNVKKTMLDQIDKKVIDNFVFHLGLAEIPTYWKSTCAEIIEIKACELNQNQTEWWKELILNGLGEFFYQNKIDSTQTDFVQIKSTGQPITEVDTNIHKNKYLVLNGGGRDSVVSVEIIKSLKDQTALLMLNPTKAAIDVANTAEIKEQIIVERDIDKKLLELNDEKYLNGHTPFSSYLSFLSVLVSLLFDYQFAVVSNEKSSNEENVIYLGKKINHQFSKSYEYEEMFRSYCKKNLSTTIEYLSIARPLYEIQISKLFAKHEKYFKVFKSCNREQKTNTWCGVCPKCLSIYISLYPFIDESELNAIFASKPYGDENLKYLLFHITGLESPKPFE